MGDTSEPELIQRCCRGEAAAWDALFDRHYAALNRFVFQVSPAFAPEDVEEICQETLLAVVRTLPSFRGGCQLQTWLFRIAVNKARDYVERQQAAKRGGGAVTVSIDPAPSQDDAPIDPPAPEPTPDATLMTQERMFQIRTALDQLGDPCREIIELRYFGDLSYEEISAALALNPKTVSSRLSKCLDRLEPILTGLFSRENPASFPV